MTDPATLPEDGFARLVAVMAALRAQEGGCPWDRAQSLQSLRTFLIEETHELLDAVDGLGRGALALPADMPDAANWSDGNAIAQFCEELGDVLLQIAFESRIAEELGWFTVHDVARGIADKMVKRHPHVFDNVAVETPREVVDRWEQQKRKEGKGALQGVPRQLPALLRGQRIGEKAARIGFDWPDRGGVEAKIDEERAELDAAIASGDRTAMQDELGDVLFAYCNLARHLQIDAEQALRGTLDKFQRRFEHVETQAERVHGRQGKAALAELEDWWVEAKARERG
jgi:MazG family protein